MITVYNLKPAFQSLLRPITQKLAQAGITANQVTIAASGFSVFTGGLLSIFPVSSWLFFTVPLILLIRMALNAIDGMLAREYNMKTPLGAILNELGDVISDVAIYLPFALIAQFSASWIVLIVILSVISEMTGVLGTQIGGSRRYEGPMGKSDRAVLFSVLAILIGLEITLPAWINIVFIITTLLLILTIYNRCRAAINEVTAP